MKNTNPHALYEKYSQLKDTRVKVTLKNGDIVQGYIIGYFYDDLDDDVIDQWQIGSEHELEDLGEDQSGYNFGKLVRQEDISEVFFLEDKTVLKM
jgi:hypothetical protein